MDGIISYQLEPIELKIEQIYLDPNNPRFVDDNWKTILDDRIDQDNVQRNAHDTMIRSHDVEKLRKNMEINGFLPIDQVIVRQLKPKKYVVLEGNRRIAAAKQIIEIEQDGVDINPECDEFDSVNKLSTLYGNGRSGCLDLPRSSPYHRHKAVVSLQQGAANESAVTGRRQKPYPIGQSVWLIAFRCWSMDSGVQSVSTSQRQFRVWPGY